ncbi:2OG-Fe(II) oxygenase [Nocardia mangyaensis]|uniref:2OG-Fe(II) oxygenase n=1 Tax=Nocardia mangyaensis TaxID=2213200 RepID=A0A1J0W1D1_9NOCA|nr:2-oxoglutarate and iron-dependent oxygenase domain-containing protein [Nocardia mangyaensis]APE38069.1 2OG-Fe(II) oxygenase [Nocardia mangyaensis]
MSENFAVPVVDISPFVQPGTARERADTARRMDEACRTVGFVQVLGHGVPADVLAGLAAAVDSFFALPPEGKATYRVPGNRGYSPPKSESLSLSLGIESASRMNDFFEAFNVGTEARSFPDLDLDEADYGRNTWPTVEGFRPRVEDYFEHAGRVARTLMRVFAQALDLAEDYFDAYTDHSVDVLRMNNYALPAGTDVTLDGDLTGMGEHTDFGLVTVLWADQVRGLQVLDHDGTWHDVEPIDGALLINLGDLTARLTNDRWPSTLHRVKPPVVEGTIRRRRSVAFFHDGNIDATIATLPSHLDLADGLAYEPILVRDHIAAKLAGSRQLKANISAVREAARVLAANSSA